MNTNALKARYAIIVDENDLRELEQNAVQFERSDDESIIYADSILFQNAFIEKLELDKVRAAYAADNFVQYAHDTIVTLTKHYYKVTNAGADSATDRNGPDEEGPDGVITPEEEDLIKAHINMSLFAFWNFVYNDIDDDELRDSLKIFLYREIVDAYSSIFLRRVSHVLVENVSLPIDKLNNKLWSSLESNPGNGQLMFGLDTLSMPGREKQPLVICSVSFNQIESSDSVKTSKKLTAFDERVTAAADAEFRAGNDVTTYSRIAVTAGLSKTTPNAKQIAKVAAAMAKLGSTDITVDNAPEVDAGASYPKFTYKGKMIPYEEIECYINGKYVDSAVHLFRSVPVMDFARSRNQYLTLNQTLLQSPLDKTEASLRLENYMLEMIGAMKRPGSKLEKKLTFETIFERCDVSTGKQRSRAREKVVRLLDFYKEQQHIKDYKLTTGDADDDAGKGKKKSVELKEATHIVFTF